MDRDYANDYCGAEQNIFFQCHRLMPTNCHSVVSITMKFICNINMQLEDECFLELFICCLSSACKIVYKIIIRFLFVYSFVQSMWGTHCLNYRFHDRVNLFSSQRNLVIGASTYKIAYVSNILCIYMLVYIMQVYTSVHDVRFPLVMMFYACSQELKNLNRWGVVIWLLSESLNALYAITCNTYSPDK
mgnify:CR=1 FL=1